MSAGLFVLQTTANLSFLIRKGSGKNQNKTQIVDLSVSVLPSGGVVGKHFFPITPHRHGAKDLTFSFKAHFTDEETEAGWLSNLPKAKYRSVLGLGLRT